MASSCLRRPLLSPLILLAPSNPLLMWATVSHHIRSPHLEIAALQTRLQDLQHAIDDVVLKLLELLPPTVGGVGQQLVRASQPKLTGKTLEEKRRESKRLANLVGFIVVRQILEPSQDHMLLKNGSCSPKSEILDPLLQAVERGSNALDFIKAPLVRDYVHRTFMSTLPSVLTRMPLHDEFIPGFSTYHSGDLPVSDTTSPCRWTNLLRILQGCDLKSDMDRAGYTRGFPTLLPGLQFLLAGIIGKPDAFFCVPAVRFVYMVLSYLTMVGFYVSCVSPTGSDIIPWNEWVFYAFGLGLFRREMQEFGEGFPARHTSTSGSTPRPHGEHSNCGRVALSVFLGDGSWRGVTWRIPRGRSLRHLSIALSRYCFQDTWNILDAAIITVILLAFIFRILGKGAHYSMDDNHDEDDDEDDDSNSSSRRAFLVSRFFLALTAPPLLARLLFLSQIDEMLGPMTQIVWKMLFHLARFSVLMVVVMVGFALSFLVLFSNCAEDLGASFEGFGPSLLTLFHAMLGGASFDMFYEDPTHCNGVWWIRHAGVFLLVAYLIIMSILLLNLLIAVLSTVHDKVHAQVESEFNLVRTKLILKSRASVLEDRVPPPLNLIVGATRILVDVVGGIFVLGLMLKPGTQNDRDFPWYPISLNNHWTSFEGAYIRMLFAFTMGLGAIGGSIILWAVSIPWVAWRIRWRHPRRISGLAVGNSRWDMRAYPRGEDTSMSRLNSGVFSNKKEIKLRPSATDDDMLHICFAPVRKDESGSGEALRIVWVTLAFFSWIVYLPLAMVLCMECILGFLLLWGRGIASVIEWYIWRSSKKPHCDEVYCCYTVTPGEERRQDPEWGDAVKIACENNFKNKRDPGSEEFNVDAFLKMTTGRNMKDLVSEIQGKKRTKTIQGQSSDIRGTQGGHKDKLSFFASRLLNHSPASEISALFEEYMERESDASSVRLQSISGHP